MVLTALALLLFSIFPLAHPLEYKLNRCDALTLVAPHGDAGTLPIGVNSHCAAPRTVYVVSGATAPCEDVNGVYEAYGVSAGSPRYERVLDDGTTYQVARGDAGTWSVRRSALALFTHRHAAFYPPISGWEANSSRCDATASALHVELQRVHPPPATTVVLPPATAESRQEVLLGGEAAPHGLYDMLSTANAAGAERLLHAAAGPALGRTLRPHYRRALPYDAITLDGLLDDALLRRALDFVDVPLAEWVGPENYPCCSRSKYRLAFERWNASTQAQALMALATLPRFVAFLEALTGVGGLIPMRCESSQVAYGSSLIGISRGGFLNVHNDFNTYGGLHRRLNVLLYLNDDWHEAWQGHLELWQGDMTRCVQRIPPVFNRMTVFTVTDDAFHGHPEPLASPDGTLRYALQFVYYTRAPGPTHSDRPGPKKQYNGSHGAIFQPTCSGAENAGMAAHCGTATWPGTFSDHTACQCNFR